jgi:hypothetical protein
MKKILMALAALVVLGTVSAQAATTTNVVTNTLNQVVTTVTDDYGVRTTSIVLPNALSASVRTESSLPGVQISTDTTLDETDYTARDIGDILVGMVSNKIYMATKPTSTNWVDISD